jgi:hypothetical protein
MRVDNHFLVDLAVLRPCFFPCKDLEEPADHVTETLAVVLLLANMELVS